MTADLVPIEPDQIQLGLGLETWSSATAELPLDWIQHVEQLGFHSVWSAEAYGADALTPLAYVAGHTTRIKLATGLLQVAARPPTTAATSLATLDRLGGGGRVIAGLGLSGPQVVEGWYGQPWGRPLTRLRDYVAIMRETLARQQPVTHDGAEIALPYRGGDASGLAKPLKSILRPIAPIPIWIAGGGPRAVAMAAEVGDGWLPMGFGPHSMPLYADQLAHGWQRRGGRPNDFAIWAILPVTITDNVRATIDMMKPGVAMLVGGMGAATVNFHRQSMERCGFADAAARIQELYLAGHRDEAAAAVPDDYLDSTRLLGSTARIGARWPAWAESGATGFTIFTQQREVLDLMARLVGVRPLGS